MPSVKGRLPLSANRANKRFAEIEEQNKALSREIKSLQKLVVQQSLLLEKLIIEHGDERGNSVVAK